MDNAGPSGRPRPSMEANSLGLVGSFTQLDLTDDTSSGSFDQNNVDIVEEMSSTSSSNNSPRTSLRTGIGLRFSARSKKEQVQNMKFMENFDPERSNREKRKLTRKISTRGGRKATLYDENGLLGSAQKDICDCLEEACPGCHFPCPKCRSNKCGHECRQNRRWMYEEIAIEGTDIVIYNPLYNK